MYNIVVMNILLCGNNNWLTKYLKEAFEEENIKTSKSFYPINSNEILSEILQNRYTNVIFCDNFFNNIEINSKIKNLNDNLNNNLYSPVKIAFFCQLYKIHFTYIGSGDIYNFEENLEKDFNEENEPNFKNNDTNTILGFTDRILKFTEGLNLRIPKPISRDIKEKENYINQLLHETKIGNIKTSVSILDDLIPIIIDLIKKQETGTYNICNQGTISDNEILELYKKYVDENFKWKFIKDFRDENIPYNILDNTLINLKYQISNIKESLLKMLENYKS